MISKLPFKRVLLDGKRVDVFIRRITDRFEQGYPTLGKYEQPANGKPGKILVDPYQTKKDAVDTVVHELLHEMAERSGLSKWFSRKDEELIVTVLSPWMTEFLTEDNRAVIEWMISGHKE